MRQRLAARRRSFICRAMRMSRTGRSRGGPRSSPSSKTEQRHRGCVIGLPAPGNPRFECVKRTGRPLEVAASANLPERARLARGQPHASAGCLTRPSGLWRAPSAWSGSDTVLETPHSPGSISCRALGVGRCWCWRFRRDRKQDHQRASDRHGQTKPRRRGGQEYPEHLAQQHPPHREEQRPCAEHCEAAHPGRPATQRRRNVSGT